jgi:hypothetical protein
LIDAIEYNTEREHLIIPEYGRHIQKMINHAKAQENKEERNKLAKAIISVMGNMQPHLRDVPDFQHKLWDQLFIMAKFDFDVDSPFDKPSEEELNERPVYLDYPQNFPKYRFYGNNIKTMMDVANTWDDGDMKEALVYTIANHMKKCFLNWNKDTVDDDVIFQHLYELSDGRINLKDSKIDLTDANRLMKSNKKYTSQSTLNTTNKKNYHKKNNNNNNNNRKRY